MKIRPLLPALMVLVVSLAATGISVWAQREALVNSGRNQFALQGEALGDSIVDVMNSHISVMRAGVGLFNAKGNISSEEWSRFVAALNLNEQFPGIQGIGYAEVVDRSRADGGNLDAESGYIMTAIRYLEPDDWRNRRAIGFNMFSEDHRRRAMARARDTDQPSLSTKVTLVQETDEKVQPGVLLYVPVYWQGRPNGDVAERRRNLRGFVYGAFRIHDLMAQSLIRKNPDLFQNIHLRLFDGDKPQAEDMLFENNNMEAGDTRSKAARIAMPMFTNSAPLTIAGQQWTAQLWSKPYFETRLDWARLSVQLVGGIVISILMAAIAAGLAVARERSQQDAAKMAEEIQDRRRAQEQAQLANRELIHRVKNTLAIVNAIASQTARHARNMNEFTRAFRERLSGLGRVHDLLRPDREGQPDFSQILKDTLTPYKPDHANALSLEGPSTPVARDDAVLLSLFINELATNAIKYGAWSSPEGRVNISWELENKDEGQFLTIRWQERNGPRVIPPTRVGFGTTVMKFAVERSMGGHAALNYDEKGVDHRIIIPWGRQVDSTAPFGQIPNKAT